MEFTPLAALKKSGRGSVRTADDISRQANLAAVKNARFVPAETVRALRLTADEHAAYLINNNADVIARGTVSKHDSSDMRTVQWLGWACIANGWSIVPQDRPGTGGWDYGSTDQRKPSKIPMDRWDAKTKTMKRSYDSFLPTQWRERRMTVSEFLQFELVYHANLAIQCCAASGHARILDGDCRDADVAQRIKELAFEHLGVTPFVRFGAKPKFQLIYRVEGDDIKLPKWSSTLRGPDGAEHNDESGQPVNAIEWLSEGAIFTAYGLHHKTDQNFDWSDGSLHPAIAGPEHAPLVTKDQMRRFVNAVHDYRSMARTVSSSNPYGGRSVVTEFDPIDSTGTKFWVPKVSFGSWTANADGKITDGANSWATSQTWALCAANAGDLDRLLPMLLDWLQKTAKSKLGGVHRNNSLYASDAAIDRTMRQKLRTSSDKWRASVRHHRDTGRYHDGIIPWSVAEDGRRPFSQRLRTGERPSDGSLDWIPDDTCPVDELSENRIEAKTLVVQKTAEQTAMDWALRRLIDSQDERKIIGDGVSMAVRSAVREWLSTVTTFLTEGPVLPAEGEAATPPAPWIVMAPTGAGKTVSSIDELAEWCRANPRRDGEGPVLLVLPTHDNANEAMEVAARSGMASPDLWTEEQLKKLEKDWGRKGVKVARLMGREASKCQQIELMKLLTAQGIGGSGLCKSDLPVYPDSERLMPDAEVKLARKRGEKLETMEVLCEYRARGECRYFNQMADLAQAEVVIVPHAYLSLHAIPTEIKNPRAIIVDESVTYSLLGMYKMPISTLSLPRKRPYVTATDRRGRKGWSDDDIAAWYTGVREELCSHVTHWLAAGQDVARELRLRDAFILQLRNELASGKTPTQVIQDMPSEFADIARSINGWLVERRDVARELALLPTAMSMITTSIAVCERANDRNRRVRPDMSLAQAAGLAEEETCKDIIEEIKFWRLLQDRLVGLEAGTAKGPRDMRWQVVQDFETIHTDDGDVLKSTPHLRLSWRKEPNWIDVPKLLLDASARPKIVEKLFGAAPVVKRIDAPLRVRTVASIERKWANASFIAKPDATTEQIAQIAENIQSARRLITTTAVLFGHGRVLVGTTVGVREVLTMGGWSWPPNVDWVHFGALRGRDFAKFHVAAISIGRSEQPIDVIDALAAALTYDDDEPEEPLDQLGTGLTKEGKPLFRPQRWSRMQMRSGHDVDHRIPSMPMKQAKDKDGNAIEVTTWALELEESWREEEIRQFVGRLRPVFRGVADDLPPPVWIAVGKIIPDGIVIDQLVEVKALLKAFPMAELVRLGGGVLADSVTPFIPGAQEILQGRTLKQLSDDTVPSSMTFRRRWAAPFAHIKYELTSDAGTCRRSAMVLPGWVGGDAAGAFQSLSERFGELGDVLNVTMPKLVDAGGKTKPKDKRDVDRDDSMLAEAAVRNAHRAQPKAAADTRIEFELKSSRGLYDAIDEVNELETA